MTGFLAGMMLALVQAGCGGAGEFAEQDNEDSAHAEQAIRGDFSQSCTDITFFNDRYLSARCARSDGQFVYSEIDLGEYLVNEDGNIWWGLGGQFHRSCSFVIFGARASELFFSCKKKDGSYKETSKVLDERIANINGVLVYRP
ncbi:hypothetical protein BON30_15895 [Cystobacter ferrugineus]|uniref:Cyanovirin-N domain-containing protein n=2 Tax=Cystobacter ferrugineus TaxID=83449 RepID=A0A1L9BE13_9BACT|nr:hypothetical protein BON30_15895 [Cystobacter ferrugineus]